MARRPKNQITPPPELNYAEDLKIDPDALDVEWLDQASVFMKYAQESANVKATLDRSKEQLEVVKAEITMDIRRNPEKYSLEKVTEKTLEALLALDPKYKAAMEEVIVFRHQADIMSAAVKAFDQRCKALEALVKLHGQQYFAGPVSSRNLTEEYGKAARHRVVSKGVSESLNRGREGRSQ